MSTQPTTAHPLAKPTARKPPRRSVTRRADLTRAARVGLADYRNALTADASSERVLTLLWAEARIQRLLALETGNLLGDPNATPTRIRDRHLA